MAKATIKIRPGIDEAVETKKYKETVGILKKAFIEQTEKPLHKILKKVEARLGDAFAKTDDADDEEEEEELTEFQKQMVRQAVEEETDSLEEFLDSLTLLGFYIWSFNVGGDDLLRSKKIPLKFDLRNETILRALQSKTDLLIQGLDETTKKFIIEKIINGIESKLTMNQVADSIRNVLPETYAKRAETVTYTEMANMINAAETETAVRNGAVTKRWITVGDDLVEEECEANEDIGDINVHDQFPSGDVRPPAHPRCRCILQFDLLNLGYFWNGG